VLKERITAFLAGFGFRYEENIELSVILERSGNIVGTGSISGAVLKAIAVIPDLQGEGLLAKIVTLLLKEELKRERDPVFVLTRPEEAVKFRSLGFRELVSVKPHIALLEFGSNGIDHYLEGLRKAKIKNVARAASLVVNCNPFTLGHRFLVEKASRENDWVYIFVVTEDRSLFPTSVRYELVREGTRDLENVSVLEGGSYIISSATFPAYFTRDRDLAKVQGLLDAELFAAYIAPAMGITRRYVGTEPYCESTLQYNQALKSVLPARGVALQEVQRKEIGEAPVSASTVRGLIRKSQWPEIKHLVPVSTYTFLRSKAAALIIEKIKKSESKH
jgi:[citrate (pro-3S)-lyase] ligase